MPFSEKSPLDLFADRLSLLSPLSDEARLAIAAIGGRPHQTRANADILRITPKSDHACLMIAGLAGRFDQLRDGERQITALHLAGDMVGLQAVVAPGVSFPHPGARHLDRAVRAAVRPAGGRRRLPRSCAGVLGLYRARRRGARENGRPISAASRRWEGWRTSCAELGLRMEQAGQGSRFEYVLEATDIDPADALGLTSVHVELYPQIIEGSRADFPKGPHGEDRKLAGPGRCRGLRSGLSSDPGAFGARRHALRAGLGPGYAASTGHTDCAVTRLLGRAGPPLVGRSLGCRRSAVDERGAGLALVADPDAPLLNSPGLRAQGRRGWPIGEDEL